MNKKKYFLALILVWGITLIPSIYYAYRQSQEDKIVDRYLSSNNLASLPISKETAVRVSDQVRKDFNTKEGSFAALNLAERPFLREDAGFLLTQKEGLCGEGARVMINLLNRLGFDATRITLFDQKLQSAHTLVSVDIGEKEFLVDSINSTPEVNALINSDNISSNDFNILHYSDDFLKRRQFEKTDHNRITPERQRKFFDEYWLYSYEAIPYSKLLTRAGFDVRAFNFERPNSRLSDLAEKPNMIMFCISLVTSVFATFLFHKLKIIRTFLRMTAVTV